MERQTKAYLAELRRRTLVDVRLNADQGEKQN
jgi:hypothetical protein